jgi:uncharacterized protein
MGKNKKKNINKIKKPIIEILKKHGVKKASIFGSYARGEEKKNSDIDILIEIEGSLLKVIKVEMELEKKLRKKIDLLTYGGINPLLKEYILKDEIRII